MRDLPGRRRRRLVAARAQELGRTYRIGLLVGALDSPVMTPAYPALRDELRKRGFIEGRNLIVEVRSIRQEPQRLFADVADLVHSNVDLIVAIGPEIALKAVLAASRTIPIVMWRAISIRLSMAMCKALRGRAATSPEFSRVSRS